MSFSRLMRSVAVVAALGMSFAACSGSEGPAGPAGKAGVAGIDGDDGTPAETCDVADNGDGSKTVTCGDTEVVIRDGDTGGPGGSGSDGTSCTVTNNGDGTKTIACTDGTTATVADGKDGLDTQIAKWEDLPGLVFAITSVTDSTGGNLAVGDTIYVKFTVKDGAGNKLPLKQVSSAGILLSGPTSNYQRVIARQGDLITASKENADGSYTYKFPVTVPAAFLAPLNDSVAFGAEYGETTGQPLANGTYTVAIDGYKTYIVGGASVRDADSVTKDVLFGTASVLAPREVVTDGNCNQCHNKIQAHGGGRREVKFCVLCHTSGAEDRNTSSVLGGTPGVTIEFGIMVHQIHNAKNLPSALGVTTGTLGERWYTATPQPLKYIGYNNTIADLSTVGFPVMPSAYVAYLLNSAGTTYTGTGGNGPMPRDAGFSTLSTAAKEKEDIIRSGVVACATCHGDPDGSGPLPAPAQGDRHKTAPTRKACGSCHTDVDWAKPYVANADTMGPQPNDDNCASCHPATGAIMWPVDRGHTHPIDNPALNTGLRLKFTGAGSGNFAAGDVVPMSFAVTDNAGADVSLHTITRFQFMLQGPTSNPQTVGPAVIPFDTGWRKSSPFTGSGSATRPGGTLVKQTYAIIFSSGTAFTVTGTTTAEQSFTLPATNNTSLAVNYGGTTFTVSVPAAGKAFAAGDRFYFEALPTASSYTMNLPYDYTFELVGYAAGATAVTYTVGNLPLYWGRQTVMERTAYGNSAVLQAGTAEYDRLVVADNATLGLAVGDRVVIDEGALTEEYVQVGRIQTQDDWIPLLDLGTEDRLYFTSALRYAHAAGATIQKVTLTNKREGLHYVVSDAANGKITLLAGQFAADAQVVVSYRADARFGWKRSAADTLQDVFQPAAADAPEVGQERGDWVGLQLLPGTYTLGGWAHKDFTVNTEGALVTTRTWNITGLLGFDDTIYRSITPPATFTVLYGGATEKAPRKIISSGDNCNVCHDKVQAHGNGREGLDTCLMCHTIPGLEDGPLFSFASWSPYIKATPGATMDFRSLMHKVHMGKELAKKDEFSMVGVFLGVPYMVTLEDKGFPVMPGEASNCEKCHGPAPAGKPGTWEAPAERSHPDETAPVQVWKASCDGCHDSDAAGAHMAVQTYNNVESCDVCHGVGREVSVKFSHKAH